MSEKQMRELSHAIMNSSLAVRYVALLQNGALISEQRGGIASASQSESDRYEELFVNPTLLTAVMQRGNVDCGGLRYVVVAYGNFYQYVQPYGIGHISVCVDQSADPIRVGSDVREILQQYGSTLEEA